MYACCSFRWTPTKKNKRINYYKKKRKRIVNIVKSNIPFEPFLCLEIWYILLPIFINASSEATVPRKRYSKVLRFVLKHNFGSYHCPGQENDLSIIIIMVVTISFCFQCTCTLRLPCCLSSACLPLTYIITFLKCSTASYRIVWSYRRIVTTTTHNKIS